jgi:hypothetical protein
VITPNALTALPGQYCYLVSFRGKDISLETLNGFSNVTYPIGTELRFQLRWYHLDPATSCIRWFSQWVQVYLRLLLCNLQDTICKSCPLNS